MLLGAEVDFVNNWFKLVWCKHVAFGVCQNLQWEISNGQSLT